MNGARRPYEHTDLLPSDVAVAVVTDVEECASSAADDSMLPLTPASIGGDTQRMPAPAPAPTPPSDGDCTGDVSVGDVMVGDVLVDTGSALLRMREKDSRRGPGSTVISYGIAAAAVGSDGS